MKLKSCPRHTHSRRDYIGNPRRFFISPSTGVTVSTPDSESGNPSSNLGWISSFSASAPSLSCLVACTVAGFEGTVAPIVGQQ